MAKMVSLKRPKDSAKDATSEYANPENDGVAVHLDHHHLEKLGFGGALKSGDKVQFSGHGQVERSETQSSKDGERHSATIRLHKGTMDHDGDADDERADLRSEISRNADAGAK